MNAASGDRTHDLRIMGPTRCQLFYRRLNVRYRAAANLVSTCFLCFVFVAVPFIFVFVSNSFIFGLALSDLLKNVRLHIGGPH
jgi:hypothetical protein